MKTIKVLGHSDERLTKVPFGTAKELKNFSVSDAVQFSSDRSSASYQYIKDLKDDDVVELIFEDDIHRWVTVAELEKDYKYSLSRGESADVIEIPPQLPTSTSPNTSRGATAWAIKALRVLKFDVVEMAAKEIADAWDDKLMSEPGLYRYSEQLSKRGDKLKDPKVKTEKPFLLFLHGTFSSTFGSFGGLPPEIWASLTKEYGDRILGFDHRTLSQSPIQNALDLVDSLPQGAKLHLVTHSRGGLLGELLSRTQRKDRKEYFDDDDSNLSAAHEQGLPDDQTLRELSKRLKSKNIKVERFVRVACPARGTTLVSGRLDRWLEIIVNVLDKVLEPTTATILGVLTDLMLELKKQAANPLAMPGLAVMSPDSGFIRMINRPDVKVEVGFYVIAGDIEKNDILGRLAIFFTDRFYDDDHDLAVQTRAMYGGTAHEDGFYYFHKGTDVNHFHYFSNRKSAEKILEALTSKPQEMKSKGFRPLSEAYRGESIAEIDLVARSYQKRSNISQPVVYIVPGIMGTHLAVEGARTWLDLLAMARGGIANLRISNAGITPHSLVALAYARLVEYLSATHEVIPFPYDWRISILEEGKRLGRAIQAKLGETNQPIRIVAHSMGGLVTRAMISSFPDVWKEMRQRKGSRFLMLGTPNKGAHKIARLILGQEKTLRMLAMLDLKNSPVRFLEIISRFPGVLQMLPLEQEPWDYLDAGTWSKFPNVGKSAWVKPLQEDLDKAKDFRAILTASKFKEDDPVAYVAGFAPGAPVGLDLEDDGRVTFLGTNEGDGTVPWRSGILPELANRTWYMNVPHGDMANDRGSFAAIYDLLQEGTTTRLSQVPPRVARAMEDTYVLPEEPVEIYPAQIDLELSVMGANLAPLQIPTVEPIKVSVAHGNLSFCNNPVAVGHYEGDSIFSAEKDLDYHLSGRLTTRHKLGLYPGPEATAEVILNDADRKPSGAIIVGLGKAGELSPRKLTQSFANALREYAIKAVENKLWEEAQEGKLAVSTLLIGTGGMGLSVANSVDAILNGVVQANNSFSQVEGPLKNVRISEIEFIELYKDQVILAARALHAYANKPEFAVNPLLRSLRGGFQRLTYDEPAGWWNRIYVRTGPNSSLIFTLPTIRARSEESQQGVQRSNIDGLVSQAVLIPKWDQKLATSMFELMIPNRLKGSFRDLKNILFVLDPQAAHYPWELLYDRRTGQDKPIAVQVGMIRQFTTASFQERVVDVKNKNVLVVGNPTNMPEGFADLPGAQQEAGLVADKFTKFGFEVTPEIHTGSNAIMNSLFANDYRVLHLAGHGVYRHPVKRAENEDPQLYTGMVLGKDIFLTANEIESKMDIPELVFINCCHLGTIDNPAEQTKYAFNEFAASLAQKLIEMGVKAVIAAGWAVDDSAALTFADEFYDRLLKGSAFGEAVKGARQITYELHKDRTNTWAAYQCYGDPDYRLVDTKDQGRRETDEFVDIDEALLEIRKLSGLAKTTAAQGVTSLQERLARLRKKIEKECPAWLDNSSLQEALADALSDMFLFEDAIYYYELALKSGKSSVSIRALEQSANCQIRLAVREFENNPDQYNDYKSTIEKQIKNLNQLMKIKTIGASPERWSMVGSGYKRLAQISINDPSGSCDQALEKMEKAYQQARDLAKEDVYPLTNLLAVKVVRLLRANKPDAIKSALPDLVTLAQEAVELARIGKRKASDDFWASVGVSDATMIDYLIKYVGSDSKELDEKLFDALTDAYSTTWRRYGSARELNSVIEQYGFLTAVLRGSEPHKELTEVLLKLLGALRTISE